MQSALLRPIGLKPQRLCGPGRQVAFNVKFAGWGQLAVDEGLQFGFGDRRVGGRGSSAFMASPSMIHLTTFKRTGSERPSITPRKRSRPRDRRDMTVPMGMPSVSATSA